MGAPLCGGRAMADGRTAREQKTQALEDQVYGVSGVAADMPLAISLVAAPMSDLYM